ncbi:MAG TPA: ABC transporter substrate-binding protein [Chloroflexota bacterium]
MFRSIQRANRRAILSFAATSALGLAGAAMLAACGNTSATVATVAPTATTGSVTTLVTTSSPTATTAALATTTAAPTAASPTAVTASVPAAARTTMSFWAAAARMTTRTNWVQKFQDANRAISVDFADVNPEPPLDKFLAAVAGGVPPDLLETDRANFKERAAKTTLTALGPYAQRTSQFSESAFFPEMWNDVQYKGGMFGVPTTTDSRALYYNADLLRSVGLDTAKPPATWDELLSAADVLSKKNPDGSYSQYGFVPILGNPVGPGGEDMWFLDTWQLGGDLVSADGLTATFTSPAAEQAITWMLTTVQRYGGYQAITAFAKALNAGPNLDPFMVGKLAMQINGDWQIANLQKYAPNINFGVAPLPLPPNGHVTNFASGYAFGLPTGIKHADTAWQFVQWFESPSVLLPFCVDRFLVPTLQAVANDPAYLQVSPAMKTFVATLPVARWVSLGPGLSEYRPLVGKVAQSILSNQVSVAAGCANANQQVQAIFDTARK